MYPRRLWDGFTFEVGVNRRNRDVSVTSAEQDVQDRTRSVAYAGRVMVGWSWLFTPHLFFAVAAGFSVGHEVGHGTHIVDPYDGRSIRTPTTVDQWQNEAEGYLRFGVTFGG